MNAGNGLVALSHEDTKRSKTELLAGPEYRQASSPEVSLLSKIGKLVLLVLMAS